MAQAPGYCVLAGWLERIATGTHLIVLTLRSEAMAVPR